MVLKPKSVLEVLYLNASAPMRKSIKRLCLYRDFEDSIVYYEEIRYMKVESVLRRESLDHFDRFENWGVIILGIMLKPNDFFSFL